MCFIQVLWRPQRNGGVAEWFKATVLKTVDCNRSMSSNPIASAIFGTDKALIIQGFVVSGVWPKRSSDLIHGSMIQTTYWRSRYKGRIDSESSLSSAVSP